MKNLLSISLIAFIVSGCSMFQTTKIELDQGNIISASNVSRLHTGMSEAQVKDIMGNPLLVNVFTPHRMEYVYTLQEGHQAMTAKRVSCIFEMGRLRAIETHGLPTAR